MGIIRPIHRDDLDMDVVAEIEAQFKETMPGYKVVFAGDHPETELPEGLKKLQEAMEHALANGLCFDCGIKMPNWPDGPESMPDDWRPADGWRWFTDAATKEVVQWQCPECDAKEQD